MATQFLRLVAVDGVKVATVPGRSNRRAKARREEREIRLCIIKEHLGHVTHSLARLKTLTSELEASLGVSVPDFMPWQQPDALNPSPEPPELPA